MAGKLIAIIATLGCLETVLAQHYCIYPYCKSEQAVVGKWTHAASEPRACYDWMFKYLNNVVPGSHNQGRGYRNTTSIQGPAILETYDTSKEDVLAMENNECGLAMAGPPINSTRPMTPQEEALVSQGRRLSTGELHQCPCAEEGRAHIINASTKPRIAEHLGSVGMVGYPPISEDEGKFLDEGGLNQIFGLHTVRCAFHSSGPCLLDEIERGVARSWQKNFSKGYVPLMDNNIMLWTPTLRPLLDLFLRDGVEFYPMRWKGTWEDGSIRDFFSVIASPCGKVLIEVAATDPGGRSADQFHQMSMARAVFGQWNKPAAAGQPLVPLRVSRAVPAELMERVLEFYGAKGGSSARRLGFHTKVLLDETDRDGKRAVTLMLSESATVHMQIWAVSETPEPRPWTPDAEAGFAKDFREAKGINQVTGKALSRARDFCASGDWSVSRYSWYVLHTHEATLGPIPENTSTLTPPVGLGMNIFMDDHISWDCTAEDCEVSAASRALFDAGSRMTFINSGRGWWPYSYDPAGYGVQLHWFNVAKGFQPEGDVPAVCFQSDGPCPGSRAGPTDFIV